MSDSASPLISAHDLLKLHHSDHLVIVDASGGPSAKSAYEEAHIQGALFADLEEDLAYTKIDPSKGGRHPLPSIHNFTRFLKALGIQEDTHVVVYDHMGGGNAAARFWWMLKAIGHAKVQVLDGGFQAVQKAGIPVDSIPVTTSRVSTYEAKDWMLGMAKMEEVEEASKTGSQLIIDVRSKERYDGDTEPIDLIAGHIPGAVNAPFADNLTPEGVFKDPETMKSHLLGIFGDKSADEIIVHCGSGVTACHTLLAADYAGLEIPKLYVGSWSEWSRNDQEMVTK